MTVTSDQARRWTAPGAQDAAKRTYASIKAALGHSTRLSRYSFEVFLQGSYANSTNVRGDSDVDIVAMLKTSVTSDTSRLRPLERVNKDRWRSVRATVTIDEFRADVQAALNDYYGVTRVHGKNKCIRVDGKDGYLDADVVPAYEHRLYTSFPPSGNARWIEGIQIRPLSGGRIVNYPKQHRRNGEIKNENCNERYKATVRQVKRLAGKAVDAGVFQAEDAPGYMLECMVFNVSDARFTADDEVRLFAVMSELSRCSAEDLREFVSCDKVHLLFVDDPGQHNEYTAKRVVDAMYKLI